MKIFLQGWLCSLPLFQTLWWHGVRALEAQVPCDLFGSLSALSSFSTLGPEALLALNSLSVCLPCPWTFLLALLCFLLWDLRMLSPAGGLPGLSPLLPLPLVSLL